MNLPSSLLQHTPWEKDTNPIWLASSIILLRNLSQYKFPPKLNELQAKQVLSTIKDVLEKSPELNSPLFLPAEETSSLDKEFLFEHFLCLDSFQNAVAGRGFIVDQTGHFLALLNIKNHLHLQLMDCTADIEGTWMRLAKIEHEMSKGSQLAYSPKFGYLTSDPTTCGTGLFALLYLHLPALIHTKQLKEVIDNQLDENLIATSLEGSLEELVGDVIVLRNHYTLGLTEENILHALQSMSMKIMASEKSIRTHLREENNTEIKDHIARAYGLLVHSYQLQTKEALNALSMIKLGVDMGYITGIADSKINEIFFQCRRAHLAHLLKESNIDAADIAKKRAEFIHSQFQGVQLKE